MLYEAGLLSSYQKRVYLFLFFSPRAGDVTPDKIASTFSMWAKKLPMAHAVKRGLTGIYHHVSEAHLHRYMSEFDYRYSTREKLGVDDAQRAAGVVVKAKGKRLTYRTTRSAGQAPTREPAAPATWDGRQLV